MHNLLAKTVVLAVIAGGFALTGDLGRLASHGTTMLGATDVTVPAAFEEPPAPPRDPARPPRPVVEAPDSRAAGVPGPVAVARPPAGGLAHVDVADLRPGDRLVVWLASPGPRCLVLDLVDPAAREALACDVAAVSADGRPLTATPPRRVVVGRAGVGLAKGAMLHLSPSGIAAAGDAEACLGPIESLALID